MKGESCGAIYVAGGGQFNPEAVGFPSRYAGLDIEVAWALAQSHDAWDKPLVAHTACRGAETTTNCNDHHEGVQSGTT